MSLIEVWALLYWWKWLYFSFIHIQCKNQWSSVAGQCETGICLAPAQASKPSLWEPIADNSCQCWLSVLVGLVPVFSIYFAYILLILFSRSLHMLASLKLKYSPCPGKGNVIHERHSDTYINLCDFLGLVGVWFGFQLLNSLLGLQGWICRKG